MNPYLRPDYPLAAHGTTRDDSQLTENPLTDFSYQAEEISPQRPASAVGLPFLSPSNGGANQVFGLTGWCHLVWTPNSFDAAALGATASQAGAWSGSTTHLTPDQFVPTNTSLEYGLHNGGAYGSSLGCFIDPLYRQYSPQQTGYGPPSGSSVERQNAAFSEGPKIPISARSQTAMPRSPLSESGTSAQTYLSPSPIGSDLTRLSASPQDYQTSPETIRSPDTLVAVRIGRKTKRGRNTGAPRGRTRSRIQKHEVAAFSAATDITSRAWIMKYACVRCSVNGKKVGFRIHNRISKRA